MEKIAKVRNRRSAGIKSKAFGELFERIFLLNCRTHKIGITRIPDSCKQISQTKIMRVKSPFDWVITYQGMTAVIDTKTLEADTFGYSNIQDHQVESLLIHEHAGGIGGYIIWLRQKDVIFFMPASILIELLPNRGSLTETHPAAVLLGSSNDFQLPCLFKAKS